MGGNIAGGAAALAQPQSPEGAFPLACGCAMPQFPLLAEAEEAQADGAQLGVIELKVIVK